MTGHEKGVPIQQLQRDKRIDPEQRMRLDAAIHRQGRGWVTGREGGRPWQLSRTNRVVACLGALMILLLISPLLIGLALTIKFTSEGPVMFVQKRTGYRGRKFGMYKFRTMVANAEELKESLRHLNKHGADAIDFKIDHDPRITRIGGFLRRTSLDELPNLINVFTGDMRLVGPRPTSFNAYRYKDSHLARLAIYPGMTGLWQISGRSNIDFDQRVELDLSYIAEQSLLLDLKILLKTPFKVFSGHGAS
ncbi:MULTISPECIES: sugar transferase [unclassified Pseudomonas]|uniref:sugar transferase n=1 Tax=unclassified Pseudomonas TaxID=196821 RepID=UPI001F5888CD|nr:MULTISPECIES: sugar transferase [unclassified Pseudomonas]